MVTGGTHNRGSAGFTLIELVIVVVIAGILVTVALQGTRQISDTARVEETRQEMDALAMAIAGNPGLHNNGVRTDFGYVGDVGALPPNLDALYANPGGYATWNGPYIRNRFTQIADDYKTDAWGTLYAFGGIAITSTGSGENLTRRVAPSSDHLLYNSVAGNVYDLDGTPP
ncbi:prepilin-type N-terminal cleavage/methylation domain-containing protein, partial [candidate division GN15 bacterium]|nr:prepilin-type N-terminal cleavage/methylation domain-containing protein [candidate division GN15 bacterium]